VRRVGRVTQQWWRHQITYRVHQSVNLCLHCQSHTWPPLTQCLLVQWRRSRQVRPAPHCCHSPALCLAPQQSIPTRRQQLVPLYSSPTSATSAQTATSKISSTGIYFMTYISYLCRLYLECYKNSYDLTPLKHDDWHVARVRVQNPFSGRTLVDHCHKISTFQHGLHSLHLHSELHCRPCWNLFIYKGLIIRYLSGSGVSTSSILGQGRKSNQAPQATSKVENGAIALLSRLRIGGVIISPCRVWLKIKLVFFLSRQNCFGRTIA